MVTLPSLTSSGRRQKRVLFFLSALLMLLAGISVIDLLTDAWGHRPWGTARHVLRGVMSIVGISPQVFYYVPLGMFLGLVVGLLLDSYKTVQGVIIAGSTLLAVPAIFLPRGVFVEPLASSFGPNTVLVALLSAAVTLRAGGVTLESLQTEPREYPRIPALIFWLTLLLVVFGFLEAHLAYKSPIVYAQPGLAARSFEFRRVVGEGAALHVVGAAVMLPALRYFTTYERGLNVIMIGPKRSGKSAVFGGLHLHIRDNIDQGGEAARRVSTLRRDIENGEFPEATQSTVQRGSSSRARSGQPMLLELPYAWGRFLKTRVRFSAVDYPGEALEEILANVVDAAQRRTQGESAPLVSDGGEPDGSDFDVPFSESGGDDGAEDRDESDDESESEAGSAPASDRGGTSRDQDGSDDGSTVEWDTTSFDVDSGSAAGNEGSAAGNEGSAAGNEGSTSRASETTESRGPTGDDREDDGGFDASGATGTAGGPTAETPSASTSESSFGAGGQRTRQETAESDLFDEETADAGRSLGGGLFGQSGDETDGGEALDPKASWEQATQAVRDAANIEQMIPGIRGCVHNADRIVLTLPLDDFVAPVIERGNVPSYLRDRVVSPDELDEHRRSEIRTIDYQGRTYAIKGPDREPLEEYLFWYESLRSVYPEKDVVIVGTMADWMLEDFRENHPTDESPQADAYHDFCEYVRDEIVREQTPAINQVFGGRDADPMYLLWYEIADEEPPGSGELRIDVSGPASVLKGARQFMQRINE